MAQRSKSSRFKKILLIESAYTDFHNKAVQLVERYYDSNFTIAYMVDGPAINDHGRIERLLDTFESTLPVRHAGIVDLLDKFLPSAEAQTATEVVEGGLTPSIAGTPEGSDPPVPILTVNQPRLSEEELSRQCSTVKPIGDQRTAGDPLFLAAWKEKPLAMGKAFGIGLGFGLLDLVKAPAEALGAYMKGELAYFRCVASSECRQKSTATQNLIAAQILKDPISFAKRAGAVVYNAMADKCGGMINCLKPEAQARAIGEVVGGIAGPGMLLKFSGILYKLLSKVALSLDESNLFQKLVAKALHVEDPVRGGGKSPSPLSESPATGNGPATLERASKPGVTSPQMPDPPLAVAPTEKLPSTNVQSMEPPAPVLNANLSIPGAKMTKRKEGPFNVYEVHDGAGKELSYLSITERGQSIVILENMESAEKNRKLSGALLRSVLDDRPSTEAIYVTRLEKTNRQVFLDGLHEGLSRDDAIKKTPIYKIAAQNGFTEIAPSTSVKYEFILRRPKVLGAAGARNVEALKISASNRSSQTIGQVESASAPIGTSKDATSLSSASPPVSVVLETRAAPREAASAVDSVEVSNSSPPSTADRSRLSEKAWGSKQERNLLAELFKEPSKMAEYESLANKVVVAENRLDDLVRGSASAQEIAEASRALANEKQAFYKLLGYHFEIIQLPEMQGVPGHSALQLIGSPNRLLQGIIKSKAADTNIYVDPTMYMYMRDAGGLFNHSLKGIIMEDVPITTSNLLPGQTAFLHEVRHAKIYNDLRKGREGKYNVDFIADNGKSISKNPSYKDFLSLEELSTYEREAKQSDALFRQGKKTLNEHGFPGLSGAHLDHINSNRSGHFNPFPHAKTYKQLADDSKNLLSSIEEGLKDHKVKVEYYYDDTIGRTRALVDIPNPQGGERLGGAWIYLINSSGPSDPANAKLLSDYITTLRRNAEYHVTDAERLLQNGVPRQ